MRVIAQSQPSAQFSYIHLAYISGQLRNQISKGEIMDGQTMLGLAVAAAILCGALGGKLSQKGRRVRAVTIGGTVGFFAALFFLWAVQARWSETRSNEDAVKHIIETRQYWALREPAIAAGVEAAAITNGAAAAMAADYYGLKSERRIPEMLVKSYRYCEFAIAQGKESHWVDFENLTNNWRVAELKGSFEAALKAGKLNESERVWAAQQVARMEEAIRSAEEAGDPVLVK